MFEFKNVLKHIFGQANNFLKYFKMYCVLTVYEMGHNHNHTNSDNG